MTTPSNEILSLNIKRIIHTSPEKAFQAWTDKALIGQWFAPTADFNVNVPMLDVKVGGEYRIEMTNAEGDTYTAIGEYLEVSQPNKLIFTWSWEGGDSGMLVTILLTAHDNGTELNLIHEKFPDSGSHDHHEQGWNGCLGRLMELFV